MPLGRRRRARKAAKPVVSRGKGHRFSVIAAPGQVVERGDGVIKPGAGRRSAARVAGRWSARRFGQAALRSARGASVKSAHEEFLLRAEQFAAGDNTRRLHLGSLRSPSVRLAGVAPELNAVRRRATSRGVSRVEYGLVVTRAAAHGNSSCLPVCRLSVPRS